YVHVCVLCVIVFIASVLFLCCLPSAPSSPIVILFFFTDPATTEIYTLSLHDALPISACCLPESSGANSSLFSLSSDEKTLRLRRYCSLGMICFSPLSKCDASCQK